METIRQKPVLPQVPTLDDAKRYLHAIVRWVGPGFHPDTDYHEYVIGDTGRRLYEPDEADSLNGDLDRAIEVLGASRLDPCEVALPVQRRLLRARGVDRWSVH